MNEEQQSAKLYGPREAAEYLGISLDTLYRLKRNGKIEGTKVGLLTAYTQKQLDNADLSRRKPGPKAGEGSRMGRARYAWPEDEKGRDMHSDDNNNSSSMASKRTTKATAYVAVAC